MAYTPQNDDLASICSSLSSDDGVRGVGGGPTNEHLIDLLTRPRSRGGYGGRLSYSEFSTLAQSLGWSSEDMDDCWYDIMMGEPTVEAVDMSRVAECVCSYCLASPLPLLESYTLGNGEARRPSRAPSSPSATSLEKDQAVKAITPPRLPTAAPPADRHSDTTVMLSPPSPKAPITSSVLPPPASRHTDKMKNCSTARNNVRATPRYAVETASSERKKRASVSPLPPSRTQSKSPSQRLAVTSPGLRESATTHRDPQTVFFRLYENGMEQQRKRNAATPVAAEDEIAACTFEPKVHHYPLKAGDTAEGKVRYNRPTKSYFAKLLEEVEKSSDAIAKAPETPRVTYHPAPGPSSNVPAGYVEGVARLRRYVASRYQHPDFKSSLRNPVRCDVDRLADAPILRLPVTVEGVADTVDVRLASARHCSPSRQQPQPQSPHHSLSYPGCFETPTTASMPRRAPSAMVRYKEHRAYF